MNTSLSIEQFNSLLRSNDKINPLLVALRSLTTIAKPEDIVGEAAEAEGWHGWQVVG